MAAKKRTKKTDTIIPEILEAEEKSLVAKKTNLPSPTDSLSLYLAQINQYNLLTKEEEEKLAIAYYEHGDQKAAERLVTSNLRFVVSVAAEYSRFGAKMIDLIQEGNLGLMHAVREFNPYKGVRLITYAVWWIRGQIREFLLKQYSMVKLSTSSEQKKLFYQLQKEQQKLEALGKELDVAAFSEELGVSAEKVEIMQNRLQKDISLDLPIDNESGTSLLDMQSDGVVPAIDESLANKEEITILQNKIAEIEDSLNEKEQFILENRLLADPPMTLQEIGDQYGISRERARQIEARLIQKIKEKVET